MHDSTCPSPPAASEQTSISEGSHRTVVGSDRTAEDPERSVERRRVRVERRSIPPSAVGEHTAILEGTERAAEASDRTVDGSERSVERRRVRVERRRLRRTPSLTQEERAARAWDAAARGDAASLSEALGERTPDSVPPPLQAEPLLHVCARGGHLECAQLLLERGADLEARLSGSQGADLYGPRRREACRPLAGHTRVAQLLEEEEGRYAKELAPCKRRQGGGGD